MERIVIHLNRHVKRRLEQTVKKTKDVGLRDRCRIILLYHEGYGCQAISERVGRVPATVVRVANRFVAEGEAGLEDRRKENGIPKVDLDLLEALLELPVGATDAEGQNLFYWAEHLPAGAVFDAAARILRWQTGGASVQRVLQRGLRGWRSGG